MKQTNTKRPRYSQSLSNFHSLAKSQVSYLGWIGDEHFCGLDDITVAQDLCVAIGRDPARGFAFQGVRFDD